MELEGIVVEEVAVVDGDDFAGACRREVDDGGAVGDDGAVGVDEGCGSVGYVVPVGCECGWRRVLWICCELRCAETGGEEEMCGFAGGAEFVCRDDFAVGAGDGFEGAGFEGDLIGDGAGVGVEFLGAEGFVVEEEFDLFGVGVDFDVFGVGGLVFWCPVEKERLAEARSGVEWGGGCGGGGLIVGGG